MRCEIPFTSNANSVNPLEANGLRRSKHDVNVSRESSGAHDVEVREQFFDPEHSLKRLFIFFLSTLPFGSISIIADQVEVEPTVGGTRSRWSLWAVTGTAKDRRRAGVRFFPHPRKGLQARC